MSFKDHFSCQAATYAKARPVYPPELFTALAALAPGHDRAWDAGAGNGQASLGLAEHFAEVIATEPSQAQLAAAAAHPRVQYRQAAETAPFLADASVDLVAVAQAVHWFDRPKFYAEVRRVLRPGGVLALWAYELSAITPEIDAAVMAFYRGPIDAYWPPERRLVEGGYRDIEFPFPEVPLPLSSMHVDWTLGEFTAYLRSWSAVNRFRQERGFDPVDALEADLRPLWGEGRRRVSWPLCGRVGRVS